MRVALVVGNQPRHMYLARTLEATGMLAGMVVEGRESFVPAPPDGLAESTRRLFVTHFDRRAQAEARFFPDAAVGTASVPVLAVTRDGLNSPRALEFLRSLRPDLLLSYGCHLLSPETLSTARLRWNIHGGLNPWYRGAITHFWPSYFLEPNMTGMTLHETTDAIDGGAIVHQTAGPLVGGDGLHDLACRSVQRLFDDLPSILDIAARGTIGLHVPKTTGRIWRSLDWRPAHLHLVYEQYADRIVDRYLDGAFGGRPPKLFSQFETANRPNG